MVFFVLVVVVGFLCVFVFFGLFFWLCLGFGLVFGVVLVVVVVVAYLGTYVTDPNGFIFVDLGRVSQKAKFEFITQNRGAYTLRFDNIFSSGLGQRS